MRLNLFFRVQRTYHYLPDDINFLQVRRTRLQAIFTSWHGYIFLNSTSLG